jgi:SAM-dependent methyltransferase
MDSRPNVHNLIRGLIQKFGSPGMKSRLWNREFSSGRWRCLEEMPGDHAYPFVERYARQGSILDLGCGPGATGNEISIDCYESYTGVDVSAVAIEKAIDRTRQCGREGKNEFLVGDMMRFVPTRKYRVILYGDSLYYIPRARVTSVVDRHAQFLEPGGVLLARIYRHDGKHGKLVNLLESRYEMIERECYLSPDVTVLAFRPASPWIRGS